MAMMTKSWLTDFSIIGVLLAIGAYFTYGTWIFRAAVYAFIVVYIAYQYMFLHWWLRGIPSTTPFFPMGDVTAVFWKQPGEVLRELYEKGKGHAFLGVWFLFRPAILLRDPELIKQVMVKDFLTFQERGIYMNKKYDPLSGHLFSLGGQKWRNLRTKLTPTFTSGKMRAMFPQFLQVSNKFEEILLPFAEECQVIDVKELSAQYATDLTTLTAFGIETKALTDPIDPFRKMGRKVFKPSFFTIIRSLMPFLVPDLASIIGLITIPTDVSKFFSKAIRDVVEYREKNDIKREDFMGILLDLKKKGKLDEVDGMNLMGKGEEHAFTIDDLAAECFLFFVGGFETAAVCISWAIYELACNPQLQTKTRQEIHRVLEKYDGQVTYDAMQELTYLDQVLCESLRMYPPVPLILRKSNAAYNVPGTKYIIPKGTQVHISVHGIQRDPEFYPNPDVFDPDRFSEEAKAKRHHFAFLPFGEGPRNCFGMRYSMMQKKMGLLTMLNKFEFSLGPDSPYPLKLDIDSFVFAPEGGMQLRITKI